MPACRGSKPGPAGDDRLATDQLYKEARKLKIEGRSTMTKDQLQRAIAGTRS
jgi:hypothetical protein